MQSIMSDLISLQVQCCVQGTSVFFQALPEGKYQLLLHKSTSYEIPASTLRIRVTGFGLESRIEGAYYEPMYLDDSIIATWLGIYSAEEHRAKRVNKSDPSVAKTW